MFSVITLLVYEIEQWVLGRRKKAGPSNKEVLS